MLCLFEVDGNSNMSEHQFSFREYTNINLSLFCFTQPHKCKAYGFDTIMPGFPYIFIQRK